MFSPEEEQAIRLIAYGEAHRVLIEAMRGMATVSGCGSMTSTGENTVIISKVFDNPNADTMEQEINEWLAAYGATEIHHVDSVRNPNSSFGMVKTLFIKVPKSIADKTN